MLTSRSSQDPTHHHQCSHHYTRGCPMSKICYTVGSYWNTWKMLESICASRLWILPGSDEHYHRSYLDGHACNDSVETSNCAEIEDRPICLAWFEPLVSAVLRTRLSTADLEQCYDCLNHQDSAYSSDC
jgi:hypothetical protein